MWTQGGFVGVFKSRFLSAIYPPHEQQLGKRSKLTVLGSGLSIKSILETLNEISKVPAKHKTKTNASQSGLLESSQQSTVFSPYTV